MTMPCTPRLTCSLMRLCTCGTTSSHRVMSTSLRSIWGTVRPCSRKPAVAPRSKHTHSRSSKVTIGVRRVSTLGRRCVRFTGHFSLRVKDEKVLLRSGGAWTTARMAVWAEASDEVTVTMGLGAIMITHSSTDGVPVVPRAHIKLRTRPPPLEAASRVHPPWPQPTHAIRACVDQPQPHQAGLLIRWRHQQRDKPLILVLLVAEPDVHQRAHEGLPPIGLPQRRVARELWIGQVGQGKVRGASRFGFVVDVVGTRARQRETPLPLEGLTMIVSQIHRSIQRTSKGLQIGRA